MMLINADALKEKWCEECANRGFCNEEIGWCDEVKELYGFSTLDPIAHLEAELNNAESEARFYGLEWKDGYKYALKVLKDYLGVK